jgi:formylmethanofuran dehydrogenase subunit B
MQEEVTRGAVTLIVDGAKLSEQVFEKAVKKFLEEIQKSQKPKIYRGRQSLKQLASQNAGLANIEISDKNIKAFSRVAKKYHVDAAATGTSEGNRPCSVWQVRHAGGTGAFYGTRICFSLRRRVGA